MPDSTLPKIRHLINEILSLEKNTVNGSMRIKDLLANVPQNNPLIEKRSSSRNLIFKSLPSFEVSLQKLKYSYELIGQAAPLNGMYDSQRVSAFSYQEARNFLMI